MKRHKFDAVSFLWGLIFTAFGLLFLIPRQTDDLIDYLTGLGTWIWPVLLLGIGLAILVPVFTADRGETADQEIDEESTQVV